MSSSNTILQITDIPKYVPIKVPASLCSFRELSAIEQIAAISCLGRELYEAIIAAKVDYTGTPEYAAGVTYNVGDVVTFRGILKRAKVQTTAIPDDVTAWEFAPTFEGVCSTFFNDFYCDYYAPWMSYVVLSKRLIYIAAQVGDTGISFGDTNYNTTNKGIYDSLERAINRDAEAAYLLLEDYLTRTATTDADNCFRSWKGLPDNTETPLCGCQNPKCNGCERTRNRNVGATRWG